MNNEWTLPDIFKVVVVIALVIGFVKLYQWEKENSQKPQVIQKECK